jgi:hypothetical protein
VLIDSLSFRQNFDLATFAGQVQSGPEPAAPSEGMANKIKLDIAIQTARDLNLTSSVVRLQGQANLHVVGSASDPVILGRTEFTGGDIFLMNQRYQIERGIIEFANPNRTEPVLERTVHEHDQPIQPEPDISRTARQTTKQLCFRPAVADGGHHLI